MNLFLQRKASQKDYMEGTLYDENHEWLCYTLEDEKREVKIPGETAIDAGTYEIKLRNKEEHGESRLDSSYSQRFDFYEGQLWLQDVPNFTWVYLHCGNDDDDTDGCPLIGLTRSEGFVGNSRDAYRKLYPIILEALQNGERVFIHIRDAE